VARSCVTHERPWRNPCCDLLIISWTCWKKRWQTHRFGQDFADDGKQGYRSVVGSGLLLIFLMNRWNIGRFPFRR
jgi:hypothetical protein